MFLNCEVISESYSSKKVKIMASNLILNEVVSKMQLLPHFKTESKISARVCCKIIIRNTVIMFI